MRMLLSTEDKIKIVKEAREIYLSGKYKGLCSSMIHAISNYYITKILNDDDYKDIISNLWGLLPVIIPEFKQPFWSKIKRGAGGYWWAESDMEIRLKYLNRLIKKLENEKN